MTDFIRRLKTTALARLTGGLAFTFTMREIQASDAKAHLAQILDEVERGETVRITRHGRPIARRMPEINRRRKEVESAIDIIKAVRVRIGKITLEELLSAREAAAAGRSRWRCNAEAALQPTC